MTFFNIEIYPNYNAGDGLLIIAQDFLCSSNCQSCTSNRSCTLCFDGFFLYEGKCYEKCPESTFSDSPTTCSVCNTNCKTCKESTTQCTSCKKGNFLQDSKYVARCKEGSAPLGNQCVSCSNPCKACTRSPTECDKYVDGYVRH